MPATATLSRHASATERTVTLPLLAVPEFVLFPGTYVTFHIGDSNMLAPIQLAARQHGGYLCLAMADGDGFAGVGCAAEIREVVPTAQGVQVRLGGLERMTLVLDIDTTVGRYVQGVCRAALPAGTRAPKAARQKLIAALLELPGFPADILAAADHLPCALWLDAIAFHLPVSATDKQTLLQTYDVRQRAAALLRLARNSAGTTRAALPPLN